jgi:UDP-2,3-diacylglucosamine pyrophosphatase LpxH
MKVRSVFISDVHLGTRGCQAERLLEFLRDHESDYLYLVGDIIDFWAMNRSIHWTPAQNTVVQKILRRARHGEHVMLIPGNHDEALREYDGISFGEILVCKEHVHVTADGRRFLLLHGDEFDQVTRYHRWLAVLGDIGYNLLVRANSVLSKVRRLLRMPGYWSLSGYAKNRVKRAVSFIFDFEDSVIHAVRERELDGVICGHIHSATIKAKDGLTYVNCGDWVDSCTAIVEHLDGRLELLQAWQTAPAITATAPAPVPPAPTFGQPGFAANGLAYGPAGTATNSKPSFATEAS